MTTKTSSDSLNAETNFDDKRSEDLIVIGQFRHEQSNAKPNVSIENQTIADTPSFNASRYAAKNESGLSIEHDFYENPNQSSKNNDSRKFGDQKPLHDFVKKLFSVSECRVPISRAKVIEITKLAMDAVHLYKHIVFHIEKFINRAKTDYKLPGVYIIDSIIRQSRFEVGAVKDPFAPRFSRNIESVILSTRNCSKDDKKKILRVLSLWKRGGVFPDNVLDYLIESLIKSDAEDTAVSNNASDKSAANRNDYQKPPSQPKLNPTFSSNSNQEVVTNHPKDSKKNHDECQSQQFQNILCAVRKANDSGKDLKTVLEYELNSFDGLDNNVIKQIHQWTTQMLNNENKQSTVKRNSDNAELSDHDARIKYRRSHELNATTDLQKNEIVANYDHQNSPIVSNVTTIANNTDLNQISHFLSLSNQSCVSASSGVLTTSTTNITNATTITNTNDDYNQFQCTSNELIDIKNPPCSDTPIVIDKQDNPIDKKLIDQAYPSTTFDQPIDILSCPLTSDSIPNIVHNINVQSNVRSTPMNFQMLSNQLCSPLFALSFDRTAAQNVKNTLNMTGSTRIPFVFDASKPPPIPFLNQSANCFNDTNLQFQKTMADIPFCQSTIHQNHQMPLMQPNIINSSIMRNPFVAANQALHSIQPFIQNHQNVRINADFNANLRLISQSNDLISSSSIQQQNIILPKIVFPSISNASNVNEVSDNNLHEPSKSEVHKNSDMDERKFIDESNIESEQDESHFKTRERQPQKVQRTTEPLSRRLSLTERIEKSLGTSKFEQRDSLDTRLQHMVGISKNSDNRGKSNDIRNCSNDKTNGGSNTKRELSKPDNYKTPPARNNDYRNFNNYTRINRTDNSPRSNTDTFHHKNDRKEHFYRLNYSDERYRRLEAIPGPKNNHITVCSRTVFIGHLPKNINESTIKEDVSIVGPICDIQYIQARGCAFVCFEHRRHAVKCIERLNDKDIKLHGYSNMKVKWAVNIGLKDTQHEHSWDTASGVMYILITSKLLNLNSSEFNALAEGGIFDDTSLPHKLLTMHKLHIENKQKNIEQSNRQSDSSIGHYNTPSQSRQLNQNLPSSKNLSNISNTSLITDISHHQHNRNPLTIITKCSNVLGDSSSILSATTSTDSLDNYSIVPMIQTAYQNNVSSDLMSTGILSDYSTPDIKISPHMMTPKQFQRDLLPNCQSSKIYSDSKIDNYQSVKVERTDIIDNSSETLNCDNMDEVNKNFKNKEQTNALSSADNLEKVATNYQTVHNSNATIKSEQSNNSFIMCDEWTDDSSTINESLTKSETNHDLVATSNTSTNDLPCHTEFNEADTSKRPPLLNTPIITTKTIDENPTNTEQQLKADVISTNQQRLRTNTLGSTKSNNNPPLYNHLHTSFPYRPFDHRTFSLTPPQQLRRYPLVMIPYQQNQTLNHLSVPQQFPFCLSSTPPPPQQHRPARQGLFSNRNRKDPKL